MPIGPFEREVLQLLAANRNPDSYLGGATVLHQQADSPRSSRDLDVFHDTTESLIQSIQADLRTLREAGFVVEPERFQESFQRAVLKKGAHSTRIEWVYDSAFRFFPVEPDHELGWRLNFWDAATNKILALFSRHEFRDYVDALFLHRQHLHLGALVWAAAGKDPGLTPELILDWVRRHTSFSSAQIEEVHLEAPIDLRETKLEWLKILEESQTMIARLPAEDLGCLYLDKKGWPVSAQPDSANFRTLTRHFGSVKGAWPKISGS